ncbi:GNAT family N-acetyltransferase [Planctellipticum variicoloris]|jgi:ribosomal protein S18 acetylase RimI-like enzyme|uniref:GNAT family N-acetyltransferase n=1 Tax=Planctellipticum variicoloris TaxID=3064265 RepID=UPI003013359E|nr:GNAT family N-acetyltransferase [Planctomycetaceae bacterium SH412]
MPLRYFKRFRMEIDLRQVDLVVPVLPAGFAWVPWNESTAERHAGVKCHAFEHEVDSEVFPCLGDFVGCLRLVREIALQPTFLPSATWLIVSEDAAGLPVDCGTIQGLAVSEQSGAVQNVGVLPEFRGQGLGRSLVQRALLGFQEHGLKRVSLEVTAANEPAVELYRDVGFRVTRTMYRAIVCDPALV